MDDQMFRLPVCCGTSNNIINIEIISTLFYYIILHYITSTRHDHYNTNVQMN
jgi:hypothetical protein